MSEFLDGELARPRRARMVRHVRHCPECRWLLASLQRTIGALQRLPPGGDSRGLQIAAAVRQRLDEYPAP
jgi:anti-sigma factor RsiW